MRVLLDTQLFVWATLGSPRLTRDARSGLMEADEVYVSAVSIWEIAIKARLGKIDVSSWQMMNAIEESGFKELAITARHAATIEGLPLHHRDPFDRLLVAQAISEPMRLMTADVMLARYSELVILV